MKCPLCQSCSIAVMRQGVRHDPSMNVYECADCSVGFLSDFRARNIDYYRSARFINSCSLKGSTIPERLEHFAAENARRHQRYSGSIREKDILDFGCGAGAFLSLASPLCRSCVGVELGQEFREYVRSSGLVCYERLEELPKNNTFDLIFAFHVFEHLSNPIDTLNQLSARLREGGTLVVEVPNLDDAMIRLMKNEAYCDFTFNLEHLFYFNATSLRVLAERAQLEVTNHSHIQRYPLANHLYWMSTNLPQGDKVWAEHFGSEALIHSYEKALAEKGMTDTVVINLSTKKPALRTSGE